MGSAHLEVPCLGPQIDKLSWASLPKGPIESIVCMLKLGPQHGFHLGSFPRLQTTARSSTSNQPQSLDALFSRSGLKPTQPPQPGGFIENAPRKPTVRRPRCGTPLSSGKLLQVPSPLALWAFGPLGLWAPSSSLACRWIFPFGHRWRGLFSAGGYPKP